MTPVRAFHGYRFPAEVMLWAVRRYLRGTVKLPPAGLQRRTETDSRAG